MHIEPAEAMQHRRLDVLRHERQEPDRGPAQRCSNERAPAGWDETNDRAQTGSGALELARDDSSLDEHAAILDLSRGSPMRGARQGRGTVVATSWRAPRARSH